MTPASVTAYFIFARMVALFDFFYGIKALRRREKTGLFLGISDICAGVITLAYMFSIRTQDHLTASIASSIYFTGIVWMLVFLVRFADRLTDSYIIKRNRLMITVINALAGLDTLIFIVNIFKEISVSYVYNGRPVAAYTYEMHPLYYAHLVFTFFLVALTLFILVNKARKTPWQYRYQYLLNVFAILLIVAFNAIFMIVPGNGGMLSTIDHSVLAYSMGAYMMYWAAFDFRHRDMVRNLSMTIFQKIGQGIVLFDYDGKLIMVNRRAAEMLAGADLREKLPMKDFLDMLTVSDWEDGAEKQSFQCSFGDGDVLRCDFSMLKNRKGKTVGNLFVLTDEADETDIMTGFQHWDYFRRYIYSEPESFGPQTAVALYDLLGMEDINSKLGREEGDYRISRLAAVMKACMPEGAYFVRGHEAHLIAVCKGLDEAGLRGFARKVTDALPGSVSCGLSDTSDGKSLHDAIKAAAKAMVMKKLLMKGSASSQTLNSLVSALRECDSETEAHVERTQKMGAALGRRIGLNDLQSAQFSLLCLLHDIGKIGIPLEILNKPGRLSEQEWALLRTHPEKGYQIAMSSAELKDIAGLILSHHECWDGKGYPAGLAGGDIPLLCRMIAIVDSYDAMVNDRAYRNAFSPEEAQEKLRKGAGSQFDPRLVEEFIGMVREDPDIAKGEHVGSAEVRSFRTAEIRDPGSGSTKTVEYTRYILDMDDRVSEADAGFTALTGYSAQEAVGKLSQLDLIPPEERTHYAAQVSNQFARGGIAFLEHELLRKDGSRVTVLCCGKRYYDSALKTFRSEILVTKK